MRQKKAIFAQNLPKKVPKIAFFGLILFQNLPADNRVFLLILEISG